MPSTAERLWDAAHSLPEPLLTEVLDFAEFLRVRQARLQAGATEPDTPLTDLCGGLTAYSTPWRTRFQADGGQRSSVMSDT